MIKECEEEQLKELENVKKSISNKGCPGSTDLFGA
tara:strand:- start:40059 stop:40163 length:105 start_codon:yes stop_codon:yes gene_type:complete